MSGWSPRSARPGSSSIVGAMPMSVAKSPGKPAAGPPAQILVSGRDTAGRQFLRAFVHFFAYHLFLARRGYRHVNAAGFRLDVAPTVFHPRLFITSEFFARF